MQSLEVGIPTNLATTTGPLILPAEGKLLRAFEQLDDGEWLVEPRQLGASGSLWSPGVRIGVRREAGSTRPSASDLSSG
ncbi:MAG: hypothetical protein R2710_30255 [Acidimicrobiales bacterium]